jgi:PAS domain S-box-containing protein
MSHVGQRRSFELGVQKSSLTAFRSAPQLEVDKAPFNVNASIGVSTELRSQTLIAAVVDGLLVLDARLSVAAANPAAERLFRYNQGGLVGLDLEQLVIGAAGLRPGRDHMAVGLRRDGRRFPVSLTLGANDQDGAAVFVCVVRDASARERAEARWRRQVDRLTAANADKDGFVRAAAHDLREPLRMVTAFCGLLAKDHGEDLDARGRDHLNRVVAAAARMRALLDDLLEFRGPGAEGAQGSWFEADVALDGAIEALGETIRESGGRIERAPLPRLWGNPARFSRLLQNLIANALKYVAPGTAPHVRISAAREGGVWRIAVADNGIGVEPRHQARIFEPFQRLHAASRYPGAGLGLAICRDIVAGFGGRLRVRSTPGEGSIFSFTVKIRERGQ